MCVWCAFVHHAGKMLVPIIDHAHLMPLDCPASKKSTTPVRQFLRCQKVVRLICDPVDLVGEFAYTTCNLNREAMPTSISPPPRVRWLVSSIVYVHDTYCALVGSSSCHRRHHRRFAAFLSLRLGGAGDGSGLSRTLRNAGARTQQ